MYSESRNQLWEEEWAKIPPQEPQERLIQKATEGSSAGPADGRRCSSSATFCSGLINDDPAEPVEVRLKQLGTFSLFQSGSRASYHMSICVEYSEDPSRTSGGRYQSVTTSLEYVLVGTDLALARPAQTQR